MLQMWGRKFEDFFIFIPEQHEDLIKQINFVIYLLDEFPQIFKLMTKVELVVG